MPRPDLVILGTRGYPSYYGGFETAVRHLAPAFADQGLRVVVYGHSGAATGNVADRDWRVESVVTPGIRSTSLATLTHGFTASIDALFRRPRVALVMNVANGFWLPMLRLAGVKTAVNVDGMEWEREKWGRLARFMFRAGAALTARFADEIICDSLEIARRWNAMFGVTGTYIPYGGTPRASTVESAEQLNLVTLVARLVPENSISEFCQAVDILGDRGIEVMIVGSGAAGSQSETDVQALASRWDHVTRLGHIADDSRLDELWRTCGVYFHGHSVGGTNPALVQAMAQGAVVLARDTVYNREVLEEAGLFVQPTADSIAAGIMTAMAMPPAERQARRDAAMARAAAMFSWEAVAASYVQVIQRLFEQGPRRSQE